MDGLRKGLEQHEISLDDAMIGKVADYVQLLWRHNQDINLTRHTDWDSFVSRDLVDTLELSKLITEGETVLDVGSGGGVPGLVLAILRPDIRITLCESVGKKARVLASMVEELGIGAEVFDVRAESLLEDFRFTVSTARAVGPLEKIGRWFDGNWYSLGRLLAVKGPKWPEEYAAAKGAGYMKGARLAVAAEYNVPGQDWKSVILKIWPVQLPEPGPSSMASSP